MEELQNQLVVSRNELKNLRTQLLRLTMQHRRDVDTIKAMLEAATNPPAETKVSLETEEKSPKEDVLKPIGVIRTVFSDKRGVPRQCSLAHEIQGYVEISSDCFTNPEHSLEGLEEFSHMWIIYHFHRNDSHSKAKVAPPRLNGERVGVFGTRSPHRPCPIGMSLVRIDRIDGNRVYFYGSDMVDGTPLFDLKPYIPKYDCPMIDQDTVTQSTSTALLSAREAPDGQETAMEGTATGTQPATTAADLPATVRVPNWITAGPTLKVLFNDQAISQIDELGINRRSIVELLQSDPRSVYLRTKHGSQIFTFQLSEAMVTCKFDDANAVVTVVQVRSQ